MGSLWMLIDTSGEVYSEGKAPGRSSAAKGKAAQEMAQICYAGFMVA